MEPDLHFILGQVPIDRDVREQKTHRKRCAGKCELRLFANDTMRAFAADQESRANSFFYPIFMANNGVHPVPRLIEADQFAATLNIVTALVQSCFEDFFRHALRNNYQAWLAGIASGHVLFKLHSNSEKLTVLDIQIKGADSRKAACKKFVGNSPDPEDFR